MKNISDYIAENLGEEGIIQKEDIATCSYGLEVFLLTVLEFSSVIIIAVFAGNVIETLCFFLSFIPLRIYTGGYHATSRLRCYVILLGVYALFSVLLLTVPTQVFTVSTLTIAVVTFVTVAEFTPLTEKKSVSDIEMKHYKSMSMIIVLVEIFISIVGMFLWKNNIYIFCFALGQLAAALSIIAAVIKKSCQPKKAM